MKKPLFDLILGTKTMRDLVILLDFKKQMITIDEIELPMQSIKEMPASRKRALKLTNSLANSKEPKARRKQPTV